MKYADIIDLAIEYADRSDDDGEVRNQIDRFLRIVEARVNRKIKVQNQSKRAVIETKEGIEYYGLPYDFSGIRDIEVKQTISGSGRSTPRYVNPEQMNEFVDQGGGTTGEYVYTIIDGQIQLNPTTIGCLIEIVYYARIPPLDADTQQENWISIQDPDIYVFGLVVEISVFTKDPDAARVWDERFKEELAALVTDDQESRWSGPALQIRTG